MTMLSPFGYLGFYTKMKHEKTFHKLQKILNSYKELSKSANKNQLTYKDKYGAVVMLRVREEGIVVAFGRGAKLQKKFPMLQGNGTVVRHLVFQTINKDDEKLLGDMIDESLILGIERAEMKRMRDGFR